MSEKIAARESQPAGRAQRFGRHAAFWCGRGLRVVGALVVVLLVALIVGLSGLAWRLSEGPVSLDWLIPRAERVIDARLAPARVTLAHASITWRGFQSGGSEPVALDLQGVELRGLRGQVDASVRAATLTARLAPLLVGHLALHSLSLDEPRLAVRRTAGGAITLDGIPAEQPTTSSAPPSSRAPQLPRALAGLTSLRIEGGTVTIADGVSGQTGRVDALSVDLDRSEPGVVSGHVSLVLGVAGTTATLNATARPRGAGTYLVADLSPVVPATLAAGDHRLAALAGITAPVSLSAHLVLDPGFIPRTGTAIVDFGAGAVAWRDQAPIALRSATLRLAFGGGKASLDGSGVVLEPPASDPGAPPPHVSLGGTLSRNSVGIDARLAIGLDQARFADLAAYWPAFGKSGARAWVTKNITAGTATSGRLTIGMAAANDLSHVRLTALGGGVTGTGLTIHWLRPVPPAVDADATLTVLNTHTLVITATHGRQGALLIPSARFQVDGLDQHDQTATLDLTTSGSVPDALALLREKRLKLLSDHKLPITDATGSFTETLHMTIPLQKRVTMAQIGIDTQAHLKDVRLGNLVGGFALQSATLDLAATQAGMTIVGNGLLAGAQSRFKVAIDFRGGAPSQVLEQADVVATVSPADLARAGMSNTGRLTGIARVTLGYAGRRDRTATATVTADLTGAGISLPIGWSKQPGQPASASAKIELARDRLLGVERLSASGPGLQIRSHVVASQGQMRLLSLDRIEIGRSDGHGTVTFPPDGSAPIAVRLTGSTLDLSSRFAASTPSPAPMLPKPAPPPLTSTKASRPWSLHARFARVLLASHQSLSGLTAILRDDGRRISDARVTTSGAATLRLIMAPDPGGRSLRIDAKDAGALISGLGVSKAITGGQLEVTGRFDDRAAGDPLAGQLTLRHFRVPAAPHAARMLQGATIYGLAGLDRPGLGFNRLVAPFRLVGDTLYLGEAHASNAAIGFTATGRIALGARHVDLSGTIVPAYFFNHMLGRLPLIGRLFSPETGGGLFAATYTLTGALADPQLQINALSALAPGALRKLITGGR